MKELSENAQIFISHFGYMGSNWGVNRTVGQIYALIYLSKKPIDATYISSVLGFSRSNISISIKELSSMNIVKISYQKGQRREYYSTFSDIWDIFSNLIEEKRQREVEPTLTMLRDLIIDEKSHCKKDYEHQRIKDMYDLISMLTKWHDKMKKIPPKRLRKLINLSSKIIVFFNKRLGRSKNR